MNTPALRWQAPSRRLRYRMRPRLLLFFILLAASVSPLLSADTPTNAPSIPLPDLDTPGVKELVEAHRASIEQVDKERKNALTTLLNTNLTALNEMLAEKKKVRNVTGIAAATTGITLFQNALTNLEAGGKFDLPEKVRREIESHVAQCRSEAATIEKKASDRKKALLASTLEKFSAVALAANPAMNADAQTALTARLNELLQAGPTVRTEPKAATTTGAGTNQPPGTVTNLPAIMASSGEADQWASVATWKGAMMGMDIITIPVAEAQVGTNITRQFNPISGQDSVLTYTVRHRLTMQDGMLFRLKQVEGVRGVELMEWPTRGNGFQLVVRARSGGQFPCHHAFELQVSVPGGDFSKALTGAVIEPPRGMSKPSAAVPPVVLTLITVPEGASVYVDDVLQNQLKTPCRLPVARGEHSLNLVLHGYATITVTNHPFTADRTIRWSFLPDPRIQKKSLTLSANAPSWTSTEIAAEKGDTLVVRAEGQWSCAPGREMCDAAGYPNNAAFYRYYMDSAAYPRQTSSAGYGALVMRIGKSGRILPIGKELRNLPEQRIAAPEAGVLFFDINEADEAKYRADNSGAMVITVTIIPAQPLLPSR